jgi:hypothetical protein
VAPDRLRRILAWLVLVPLVSCGGRGSRVETSALPVAKFPSDSCPTIRDSTVPDSSPALASLDLRGRRILVRDGPSPPQYVSILIDGQWAAWNDAQGRILGPDLDPKDIETVDVLKGPTARLAYGTCPGVGLIIITTKSKKWRPYPRDRAP